MNNQKELPIISLEDLVKAFDQVEMDLNLLDQFSRIGDAEKYFEETTSSAKKNFKSNDFLKFWEVFLYFIFGEIELKSKINKYIQDEKPSVNNPLTKINLLTIDLLGSFITNRHDLVDYIYEGIINQFRKTQTEVSKNKLIYDIQKYIIICMSALKIIVSSLNQNSIWLTHQIHREVIDDIEYSLYSALYSGDFEFKAKS